MAATKTERSERESSPPGLSIPPGLSSPSSPSSALSRLATRRERLVWSMLKAGDQPERIAAKLHITPDDVDILVKQFEAKRAQVSSEIVDMVVNAEVLTSMSGVGNRIQSAMQAQRFTGAYDANGAPIMQPDHTTALDAIEVAGGLLAQVRPKGGGVNVAVGIQNSGNGNGTGTVKTFEQRVREKRGILPDSDVKFLSDGKGEEVVYGDVIDDEDEDNELEDEELGDGTSDAEIEEMDDARD